MDSNGLPHDSDRLLAALATMPVDALQIMQWFVNELVKRPDDNDHRKEILNRAIAKMSALRSV